MANVEGSGRSSMSSSSPRTKPSIDPPSKVIRPSRAASSWSIGIETFLLTPKMSAKTRRTNRALCSRASLTTSRLAARRRDSGRVVEFINCYRQAKRKLIVWAFQRARRDFGDLPQPVKDGMTMDVQLRSRRLDVLSELEIELQGSFQLGLMFRIVVPQRREGLGGKRAQPLDFGALV